jgi:hypothetical protein
MPEGFRWRQLRAMRDVITQELPLLAVYVVPFIGVTGANFTGVDSCHPLRMRVRRLFSMSAFTMETLSPVIVNRRIMVVKIETRNV